MNLAQFIANETGQAVCVDGTQNNPPATNNSGQCVQLVALYSEQVNGVKLPLVVGAVNLWNNVTVQALGYVQVPITELQTGDIIIFGASSTINSPKFGHTDIYVKPISGGYQGFDSNWQPLNLNSAGYPTAHLTNHTFADVLGGLRFQGGTMPEQVTDNFIKQVYLACLGRAPSNDELVANRGYDPIVLMDGVINSSERLAYANKVANALAGTAEVTKTEVTQYINDHLN